MSLQESYATPPYLIQEKEIILKDMDNKSLAELYNRKFGEIKIKYQKWHFKIPEIDETSDFSNIREIYLSVIDTIKKHNLAMRYKLILSVFLSVLYVKDEDSNLLDNIDKYDADLYKLANSFDLFNDSKYSNICSSFRKICKDFLLPLGKCFDPAISLFFDDKLTYDKFGLPNVPDDLKFPSESDLFKTYTKLIKDPLKASNKKNTQDVKPKSEDAKPEVVTDFENPDL